MLNKFSKIPWPNILKKAKFIKFGLEKANMATLGAVKRLCETNLTERLQFGKSHAHQPGWKFVTLGGNWGNQFLL